MLKAVVIKPQGTPTSRGDLLHLLTVTSHLTSFRSKRSWRGPRILRQHPSVILKHSWATIFRRSLVKGGCISTPQLKELMADSHGMNTRQTGWQRQYVATKGKLRMVPTGYHSTLPRPRPRHASYRVM